MDNSPRRTIPPKINKLSGGIVQGGLVGGVQGAVEEVQNAFAHVDFVLHFQVRAEEQGVEAEARRVRSTSRTTFLGQ